MNPPIIWIDPDNNEISVTDTKNYVIDQGSFFFGSKISTLTIKTAKFASLSSENVFKCKVKSAKYPDDSPDVEKEMTLTLLTLGNSFILTNKRCIFRLSPCLKEGERRQTVNFTPIFLEFPYLLRITNCKIYLLQRLNRQTKKWRSGQM